MIDIRVIALPTETVQKVLATMKSPGYGHPAHREVATGHGPCRHCLKPFQVGVEERVLFTCNPFYELAEVPLPGPVFVHGEMCERFDEEGAYPRALLRYPVALDGYDAEQRLVSQRRASDGAHERVVGEMLQDSTVRYVLVRDLEAGCFDFRVERRTLNG